MVLLAIRVNTGRQCSIGSLWLIGLTVLGIWIQRQRASTPSDIRSGDRVLLIHRERYARSEVVDDKQKRKPGVT